MTRLTLLHSRGEGKGREGQRQCGRGGANRVLGLQMGGVVVGGAGVSIGDFWAGVAQVVGG